MLDDGSGATGTFHNFKAVLQARMAAQQHQLHHSLRHVLEVVAGFTNGHPAFPSYELLAGITGLKADAVRKQVKALVDLGYLARTRRPAKHGGWGQPEWALGPTCLQVGPPSHLTQVEVGSPSQSTGTTVPLASGTTVPQKRRVSGPTESVVQDHGSGKPRPVVKRLTEEKGREPHPTQLRVAGMIDALKAVELPSKLTAPERAALLASDLPAAEIAAVMRAIADRKLGDQWDADHLTVNQGIKLHRGWVARQRPNGKTPAPLQERLRRTQERMSAQRPAHPF